MAKGKKSASSASGAGFMSQIEDAAMPIVSAIPLAQVKTFASAYFHPVETYESNKKMEWGAIAVNLVLIGLVLWIANLLQYLLGMNFTGVMVALFAVLGYAIGAPVMAVIGSIVYFVLAKIFGGKGGFREQTAALSLVMGGIMVLGFPFIALSNVLLVGWIFGLLYMLVSLYGLYNMYLVVKGVHSLSSVRAAAVVLIPILLAFLVAFMMAAALAGLMVAAGMGSTVPRPYGY